MAIPWNEQYKHPLWQKKRLEAMEAAGFECSACGDKETMLHVHHHRYVKGRMMWEYELNELNVMCAPCHEERHYVKDQIADLFMKADDIDTQAQLLQIGRGFLNATAGPYFADRYPRPVDQDYYWVGFLAGALANAGRQGQGAIARAILDATKTHSPRANLLHEEVRLAGEWLEKEHDE